MTDICAGCRKPIVNVEPVIYKPYNPRNVTTSIIKCHPTSKCVDMLYRVTDSDRTMMKRVIELSRQGNEQ